MAGLYLQTKSNRLNNHSLYFRIRVVEGNFTVSTKISINVSQWDANKSLIKANNPLYVELNKQLRKHRDRIEDAEALYRSNIIIYSELKDRCNGVLCSNPLETILQAYNTEKGVRTVQAYQTALNSFKKALSSNITISDINYTNISRAISYWKRNKLSPTTINTYLRHLISLRNNAYKRNLVENPIEKDRSFRQRVKELEIKSITKEIFLEAVNLANTRTEVNSLKLYLLSFACRGLYFGDFRIMNPKRSVFTHYRHKTGNRMLIDGLDGLVLTLYNSIDLDELAHSRVRKYQTAIIKLINAPHKSARKTFDSYALLLGTDFQIRLHLLGQRDASIKRYYTNFEMVEIQKKVHSAHRDIVNHFGVGELTNLLLSK